MRETPMQKYSEFFYYSDCNKWKDSFYESKLLYSLHHLTFVGDISKESIMEALQRSISICNCAGVDTRRHFKQIYVYDCVNSVLKIDWLMSKTGFNMMVFQIPTINTKISKWIWKLADEKVDHN